jgi:hypothetical protein
MSVLGNVGAALAAIGAAVAVVYGIKKIDDHVKFKKNVKQLQDALPRGELADALSSHAVASVKALNS